MFLSLASGTPLTCTGQGCGSLKYPWQLSICSPVCLLDVSLLFLGELQAQPRWGGALCVWFGLCSHITITCSINCCSLGEPLLLGTERWELPWFLLGLICLWLQCQHARGGSSKAGGCPCWTHFFSGKALGSAVGGCCGLGELCGEKQLSSNHHSLSPTLVVWSVWVYKLAGMCCSNLGDDGKGRQEVLLKQGDISVPALALLRAAFSEPCGYGAYFSLSKAHAIKSFQSFTNLILLTAVEKSIVNGLEANNSVSLSSILT